MKSDPLTDLRRGELIDGLRLCAHVHTAKSSVIYQARQDDGRVVAVKSTQPARGETLEREAAFLGRLGGIAAPGLVGTGSLGGQPYLATTWKWGVESRLVAAEFRSDGHSRAELVRLGARVLAAYAQIHAVGVLH